MNYLFAYMVVADCNVICENNVILLNNKLNFFCIRETPKQVLLQIVKTLMKYSIMQHFIRIYTVCKDKKDLQAKEYNI